MVTNRHVLVTGGLRDAHKRLLDLGVRLSLMIDLSHLTQGDIQMCKRIIGLPTAASIDEWVRIATLIHELDPFDAIGGFSETAQIQTSSIASALSLPFHSKDTIESICHKSEMRGKLVERGVDMTTACIVSNREGIEEFANKYGYPIILKPNGSRGSTGISKISGAEGIVPALAWFQMSISQSEQLSDRTFEMLVEPYLVGDEFSVETFSEEGCHRIIAITQKFKELAHFVEIGHCIPACLDSHTSTMIEDVVIQTLTALGVQSGPAHTEVIVTNTGPKIVETHTRLGGDNIPYLIELVTGIDLLDLWVRQVLGEKVWHQIPESIPVNRYAAIWYSFPETSGYINAISGEEEARSFTDIIRLEVMQGVGTILDDIRESSSRMAYAIATGSTPEYALTRAQEAIGHLTFEVTMPEEPAK